MPNRREVAKSHQQVKKKQKKRETLMVHKQEAITIDTKTITIIIPNRERVGNLGYDPCQRHYLRKRGDCSISEGTLISKALSSSFPRLQ